MRDLRTRIEIDINNNIELVSRAILQKMESLISAPFSNHLVACSSTCNAVGIGPSAPSLFLLAIINNNTRSVSGNTKKTSRLKHMDIRQYILKL